MSTENVIGTAGMLCVRIQLHPIVYAVCDMILGSAWMDISTFFVVIYVNVPQIKN